MQALSVLLAGINERQGPVKNIIHSVSVPNDDVINSIDMATFEQGLRPIVLGSWNLHLASQELGFALDSFVLLNCVR